MKKAFFIFLVFPWLFCPATQAQIDKHKILVSDLTRIKQISDIAVSPDGKRTVYTLTAIEQNEENKEEYDYRTHLYLNDLQAGSVPKVLTHGRESARQPCWSPDGKAIAFSRDVKGKSQIFVLPLDGGEAWQLTNIQYGATKPKWSPDGKRVLFTSSLSQSEMLKDSVLNPNKQVPAWSLEKPGFVSNEFVKASKGIKPNPDGTLEEIRAYLAKNVEDKKVKVINRIDFQGESTTEPEQSFAHLYTIDVQEGATPKPLTYGYYSFRTPIWMPDGKGLLAIIDRDTLRHPDREQDDALIWLAADGSGRRIILLAEKGRVYSSPAVSADGRQLALLTNPSQGIKFGQLAVATLDGTTVTNLEIVPFDRAATNLTWASTDFGLKEKKAGIAYSLYFTATSNGGVPLYRFDMKTKQVVQLTDFNAGITSFDIMTDKIVFSKTEVANPSELYFSNTTLRDLVKLSSHNAWVTGKTLSFPEKRTWKNSKGQIIEYWIMKPVGIEPGRKYPLLLQMHGGPTAMWGPGESTMWHELQFFCSQGYGIVYANPRGSGGYGLDFQRVNYQDWGTGPTEDVLAAVTDAAKETWVDTSRQVITGGSYAGYLTAWIIGHDNRFKAAFAQRGVYDLTTFMGEGNAWRLIPDYFGGYPWQKNVQMILDANSPYTFVENIRTPLLIKHGENDLRTGVIQSEMLYKSLKVLGRPVEYVRVPGATHELSRTGNVRQRIDRILRIYEFFERYVGEKRR